MPSQRESQKKPLLLSAVAGINQRDRDVELPPSQYSLIQGTFPEFAGLQSRLWGKRTLAKYSGAIYSIYQFWSPYGYGIGLYQFTSEMDYGTWLTPTTEIETALLPNPSLSVDGGNFTVNEFGYGYGANFSYANPNVCGLIFTSTGTEQINCISEPAPVSIPDDHNGGPAGQGRKCRWVTTGIPISLDTYVISAVYGDTGPQDIIIGTGPPIIVPLPAIPTVPYAPEIGPPWGGYIFIYHMERGSYQVGADYHNNWRAYGGKIHFDFTALFVDPTFVGVVITLHRQILTVGLGADIVEQIFVNTGEFSFEEHINTNPSIRDVSDGHQQILQTYFTDLTAIYRQRVCS